MAGTGGTHTGDYGFQYFTVGSESAREFDPATAVNTTTDRITFAIAHNLETGMKVYYHRDPAGTNVSGLSS